MRARLFTLVFVVLLAVGVAVAAVVVVPGWDGEEAGGGETQPAAAPAVVGAEDPPQPEEPAVATPPEPVTLRYDRLDITGAATAPGSYAFLETAGDSTSAIAHFDYGYSRTVELRIHPTDASGTSRAAFYDTVQVGDSFDYQTNGLDCAFRFKVTSVAATASPRTLSIEYVHTYGQRCGSFPVDDPASAKDVNFVWGAPAGTPGPDGVRLMLTGEPAGPGTYRLFPGLPYVIDVPAGMQVIHQGYRSGESYFGAPSDQPAGAVLLIDAATGGRLFIDPRTGRETRRITTSPDVGALFDLIIASLRRVDGAEAGAARAPVTTPPEPVTFRYNLLDITGGATAPGSYAFLHITGDAASATDNFSHSAWGSVELRVHPTDASGASRAAFYDTVEVGDTVDYRMNGVDCGARFKVTSVAGTATPRTFGIEQVTGYGGWCPEFVDDPGAARDVDFVWRAPPGIEGPRGVRVLLQGEPAGPGTYYIHPRLPYIIDVPVGSQVVYGGVVVFEGTGDLNISSLIRLLDPDTGSALGIDPDTGEEVGRIVLGPSDAAPDVHALFDHIMASIRRVE